MNANRYVKWSKEALEFWESSPDNSVVCDIIVSYACLSQTGEGFEDLVNSINDAPIRNKIKEVVITDTSYMYRYCIHEFSSYSNANTPTMWYLNNRPSIEKLTVDTVIRSWSEGLKSSEFEYFHKKILMDYEGDRNGNGVVREFRDLVFADAAVAAYKNNYNLDDCISFMLEECAYACAFLSGRTLLYPMSLARCMLNAFKRYNIGIVHLNYKTSRYAQKHSQYRESRFDTLDKEIATFMKEKVTNVNFFVIDKFGNHIYKNYALDNVIGDINAKRLTQQSWDITSEVIKTRKQIIVEENYKNVSYLSIKAPLTIDGEVEGVIGLAVDITDRKKAEQLEKQKEIQFFAEQVAHDITSPLIALSSFAQSCEKLSEKDHITLRNIVTSIESICKKLLRKYEKPIDRSAELYISPYLSLLAIVNDKNISKEPNITFNYSRDSAHNFIFISGDYSDFCRMISNLLNNSVEAVEKGKKGIVDVSFTVRDRNVEIYIKDNGKGMPQEVVDKILNDIPVSASKQSGHGIGMRQVKQTLDAMKGRISIKSTENVGTEITLVFPECDPPKWFSTRITLSRGDTVVALDDDPSILDIWKRRFEKYSDEITIKYFTQAQEAIDFINSLQDKSKLLLLTDYDLRDQKLNGVEVIEKSRMQNRSIVVTSAYISKIKEFNEKIDFIKLIPKPYINKIPIAMKN